MHVADFFRTAAVALIQGYHNYAATSSVRGFISPFVRQVSDVRATEMLNGDTE